MAATTCPEMSCRLSVLRCSNLGRNSLSGDIPPFLWSMPSIAELYVARPVLFSPLGFRLGACGRSLPENRFGGTLPTNITQMPSLRKLCAACHESRQLPTDALRIFPLVCRNVKNNLLEGDVGPIVRNWSGSRYTSPPLWSLRLLFTVQPASPAFHQRQPEHASVGAHAQPPTHRAKPHAQKHARTRTSTSCQPFLSPFSLVCSGIATMACSLELFPQQGKCVGSAERVGQDQATSNFGRCGRPVCR